MYLSVTAGHARGPVSEVKRHHAGYFKDLSCTHDKYKLRHFRDRNSRQAGGADKANREEEGNRQRSDKGTNRNVLD